MCNVERLQPKSSQGFTLIELVLVVAIFAILAFTVAPYLSDSLDRRDIDLMTSQMTDALHEAQATVMSGKDNSRFGVHFESTKFVFFEGSTYSAADANNVVHTFSGRVSISAISLSPGGSCTVAVGVGNCDVHFRNHYGSPVETGSVTVINNAGQTKTVSINAIGVIAIN